MPGLTLEGVLENVVRGRLVRLELSRGQKRALRDRDGQIALDVLRHLLGAREALGAVGRFPVTEHAYQAIARKIGYEIGQKRARTLTRRLVEEGVIEGAGHYALPDHNDGTRSGYHVRLFRLAVAVVVAVVAARKIYLPVGRRPSVKRPRKRRWWQHPLFGDHSGRPPPHLTRRDATRMSSLDEAFQGLGVRMHAVRDPVHFGH